MTLLHDFELPEAWAAHDLRDFFITALRAGQAAALLNRFSGKESNKDTPGRTEDVRLFADIAAQAAVVNVIRGTKALAAYGIGAEETGGSRRPTKGQSRIVTVDMLDASKFLGHDGYIAEVGGLMSLINALPGGAYDILAGGMFSLAGEDIYLADPWSDGVLLVTRDGVMIRMPGPRLDKGLRGSRIIVRESPMEYSGLMRQLLLPPGQGGLAGRISGADGSIPLAIRKLIHGIATALVMPVRDAVTEVWDHAPLAAFLRAMGMKPYVVLDDGSVVTNEQVEPQLLAGFRRTIAVIWIHETHYPELAAHAAAVYRAHREATHNPADG